MQPPSAAAQLGMRKLRTLLVDPDVQDRQILELELSVRGQAVVSCSDAQFALTAFNDNVFHLVLISCRLPDGHALTLSRDIRDLPGGEDATIVIVCGKPGTDECQAAIDAGADDYLVWTADGEPLGNQLDVAEQIAWGRLLPGQVLGPGASERFLVINPNGTVRRAAPVAERLLGFPPEAIVGVNAFGFFHPDDAPLLLSVVTEAFAQSEQTRAIEVRVRRDGDAWRTVAISATNATTDPRILGIVFDLRGPEASVGIDDQVTRAVMHDRVTDLPNRSLFIDRVDHAVVRASRRQQSVVVMVIDFNDFVDAIGHASDDGDDGLIVAVAQRLRSCLRSSDTAARLGHDHFAVLLEDIASIENIAIVAERMIRALSVPFVSGGVEVNIAPHIGVAVTTMSRNRAADLLQDANIARAWARVQGCGSHVMFDPSMQPPDDEPITSEYAAPVTIPATTGLDQRLDVLNERIASLEQTLSRLAPVPE